MGAERPLRVFPSKNACPAEEGPGEEKQRTLKISQQIQKSRAFIIPLQLKVLQVIRLILKVKVSFLLPLLFPLPIQEPEPITLFKKPFPLPLPLPLQVLLPREETPLKVQEPHSAFFSRAGF